MLVVFTLGRAVREEQARPRRASSSASVMRLLEWDWTEVTDAEVVLVTECMGTGRVAAKIQIERGPVREHVTLTSPEVHFATCRVPGTVCPHAGSLGHLFGDYHGRVQRSLQRVDDVALVYSGLRGVGRALLFIV